MTPSEEFQHLIAAARLTLSEYDFKTRIPKDFKEIYDLHLKEFPNYPVDEPPAPPVIAILSFSEVLTHLMFLKMLEKAINLKYKITAQIVSKNSIEGCKLIIAPDYGIWGDPHLSKQFREGDKGGQSFLDKTPLFLLTDLALYMREPKLKRSLWTALCQEIEKLGLPKSS